MGNQQNKDCGVRSIYADTIRQSEEGSRRFTLSFSSEEPYDRWFGTEILSHAEGSSDLSRLNSVGVLLFNHDPDKVIGRILRAWTDGNRNYAEVEFDEDDFSEKIYKKVLKKTLKTTSVRYSVSNWEVVKEGKKSTDGRFKGPCHIATRWQCLEVSIVSVPADATVGVGRSNTQSEHRKAMGRSIKELQSMLDKSKTK